MHMPFEDLRPAELRGHTSIKWSHYGPDVLPLWVAEMDVLPAPEVQQALVAAVRAGDTGYPGSGRTYAQAFAGFAGRRWGWQPDPAHTAQCADVMTGIRVLVESLTDVGGTVVIPSPVYPPFALFALELRRHVATVDLTTEGRLDLPAIEAALSAVPVGQRPVLLLCSPHNPTGVVHTRAELLEVARIADARGAHVIVDEVHAPLVPEPAQFVAWLEVAGSGFVVTSAAKAFNLAGLKAGLIVAAPESAPLLANLPGSVPYGASHLGVIGHSAGYASAPDWLDGVNANIAANRDLLGELLAEHLPGVGYRPPQATYLAWLDLREYGLGEDPAAVLLRDAGVALTAGLPFGPGGAGHARLNLACSREVLTEAVARMAEVLADSLE